MHNSTSAGEFILETGIENEQAYLRLDTPSNYTCEEFASLTEFAITSLAYASFSVAYDKTPEMFDCACIHFCHSPQAEERIYREIFRMPVLFNQQSNQIRFDKSYLALPLVGRDIDTYTILKNQLVQKICHMQESRLMHNRVHSVLMALEQPKVSSIAIIAEDLSTSVSTLQRKLQNEGVSFRSIQTTVLEQRAKKSLRKSNLPIHEIAIQLGYLETNSFHRAFKRWAGMSPSEYREEKGM